jgi:hypothetical protein
MAPLFIAGVADNEGSKGYPGYFDVDHNGIWSSMGREKWWSVFASTPVYPSVD